MWGEGNPLRIVQDTEIKPYWQIFFVHHAKKKDAVTY